MSSRPDTPADRAYVAMRLDQMDGQLDQARAAMRADLDLYRDDFTTRHDEELRAHNERTRALEEQNRAYLTSFYDDGYEGTQDVGQGHGASAPEPAPAPERGSGQPSPWDAELAEAERIRALPMTAWSKERQSMIRANRGLFSQETR